MFIFRYLYTNHTANKNSKHGETHTQQKQNKLP